MSRSWEQIWYSNLSCLIGFHAKLLDGDQVKLLLCRAAVGTGQEGEGDRGLSRSRDRFLHEGFLSFI